MIITILKHNVKKYANVHINISPFTIHIRRRVRSRITSLCSLAFNGIRSRPINEFTCRRYFPNPRVLTMNACIFSYCTSKRSPLFSWQPSAFMAFNFQTNSLSFPLVNILGCSYILFEWDLIYARSKQFGKASIHYENPKLN
jgi:hypothetical protein